MLKRILSYLIVGGGCSGVAILSTSFVNMDERLDNLLNYGQRTEKITKINNYGDIEAYGLQNGCVFRIVDEEENKDYSLTEFYTNKKDSIISLETGVVKVAESGKLYCGKDTPIVTIFYKKEKEAFPPFSRPDVFKLKKSEIITSKNRV